MTVDRFSEDGILLLDILTLLGFTLPTGYNTRPRGTVIMDFSDPITQGITIAATGAIIAAVATGLPRWAWGGCKTIPSRVRNYHANRIPKPLIHNLPYSPLTNNLFRGRSDELKKLEKAFKHDAKSTVISQKSTIHGLGGIGKTRLAVEFAWRELESNRCKAAWFVRGDSPERLETELAELATRLYPNKEDLPAEQPERLRMTYNALGAKSDWLLIIDNVDTPAAKKAMLENALPNLTSGHILITSRISMWPAGMAHEELDAIPLDEAGTYLIRATNDGRKKNSTTDRKMADRLAEELARLPLALELAAAYIRQMHLSFDDYLEHYEKSKGEVLNWRDEGVTHHPESIATAWNATIAQLGLQERAILRLASFLSPEPVPRALFQSNTEVPEKAATLLAEELGTESPETEPIQQAVGQLSNWSMIQLNDDSFTVHRLVQATTRLRIPAENKRGWLALTVQLLNDYIPEDPPPYDVRSWPLWESIEAHIQTVLSYFDDDEEPVDGTSRLLNELGLLLNTKARFNEAESLMRKALDIDRNAYGDNHTDVATNLNNLAGLLRQTGRLEEAEPLYRKALDININAHGENHTSVATHLNNLAGLLLQTGRLEEAEPLMRDALDIDRNAYGDNHTEVATDLNNLAGLLRQTGRLEEAEPHMRKALDIDRNAYGDNHTSVARDLNNLAALLLHTGRLEEAEPLMRKALDIDRNAYGDNHTSVAIRLNNLAQLLQQTGRLDEAEPLAQRAVEILEGCYGPEHNDTRIAKETLEGIRQARS